MENKRLIAFSGNPDSTESKALASFAIAGSAEASGIQTFNGNKYSVSYAAVNRLNETWHYVTATPLSQVTAPIQLISRWLVGMSIGLIFRLNAVMDRIEKDLQADR